VQGRALYTNKKAMLSWGEPHGATVNFDTYRILASNKEIKSFKA